MTELTIKLIIILIPGALGCLIYEKLTIHQTWSPFRFTLNSILLGSTGYLIIQIALYSWQLISKIPCITPYEAQPLSVWTEITNGKLIPYGEIISASIIGIILGFILTYIEQNKVLNRFSKKLKISSKYGDENLYSHFLNADEIDDIYLRDIKNNLVYHGVVSFFSENENFKEIVLNDVSVYRYEDSEHLYDLERIYLSLKNDEVSIESPFKSQDNE